MPGFSDDAADDLPEKLVREFKVRGLKLATAESCTGGLIAKLITDIPGSSAIFETGYVTYSNKAKSDLLRVSPELLGAYGAVSAEVAAAMAEGAQKASGADMAVSCTGIAGPGGGSAEKPVGLVHIAIAGKSLKTLSYKDIFSGDRKDIRMQTALTALGYLLSVLETHP